MAERGWKTRTDAPVLDGPAVGTSLRTTPAGAILPGESSEGQACLAIDAFLALV
jgi:hypothetical protein